MLRKRTQHPQSKCLTLALCFVMVVVVPSLGQSLNKVTDSRSGLAAWGLSSLYHADQGFRGAASCATSNCHGGPTVGIASETAPRGSEYPIWLERDPHAQSWKTICSDASFKVMSQLGILKDGIIADMAGYRNCLACHNTEKNLGKDQLTPTFAEGVGCESCHGPSQTWFDQHYQGTEATRAAKRTLGLTDSGPLLQRAKICTTCHVGSRDRDMNHDIIAAGHPALYFDMAVYHEAYPKHWRDPEQNSSDFRAKLWLAGQIAAADSELELLESRACKSLPHSTWPELSLYQCNSCHFPLNGNPKPSSPTDRGLVDGGRAPIREWNLAGLSYIPNDSGENEIQVSARQLRFLLTTANSDAKSVAAEAQRLRVQLYDSLFDKGMLSLPKWSSGKQREISIQRLEESRRSNVWERAAGAYTAVWALGPTMPEGRLEKPMKTMRAALLFQKDMMSASFPRSQTEKIAPTSKDWDTSLLQLISALKNEVR